MTTTPITLDRSAWNGGSGFNPGSPVYLSIALAGAHYDRYSVNSRSKCGGVTTYSLRPEDYYHVLAPGGLYIDKRTVPDDDLWSLVISGPMLDVDLPPRTIERFNAFGRRADPDVEPTNTHGSAWLAPILEHRQDQTPGCPCSLDNISLDLYAELWEAAGARIGVRTADGRIEYADRSELVHVPEDPAS